MDDSIASPREHRHSRNMGNALGASLEAVLHEALTAQAACAKAKSGTEGEARDEARAALRAADEAVQHARSALKQLWVRTTAEQLQFEARATTVIHAESQGRANEAIQQAWVGATASARDERRREAGVLAREVSDDTRRAFANLEDDRRMLRLLEMRADDPTFQGRVAMEVADLEPRPFQPKPWGIVGCGSIPPSVAGAQPNLADYSTIKRVSQFRTGGRAVLDQATGRVAVRIEAVQLAQSLVPTRSAGERVAEATYLVRPRLAPNNLFSYNNSSRYMYICIYIHIHTYVYTHIDTHLYIHMSVEQIRRRLRTHSQTSCGEKKKLHIYIMKRELTEETVHES